MSSSLQAIIFDFDGLLADSELLHFHTFAAVLAAEDIVLSRVANDESYIGLDVTRSFEKAFGDAGEELSAAKLDSCKRRKAALFEAGIEEVTLFPGIQEIVEVASERHVCAIASGSQKAEVDAVLDARKIRHFFHALVTADDGLPSKPAPEILLRARDLLARQLKRPLSVSECLVVEDSVPGILAAKAAGMRCVALAQSHPPEMLQAADLVLDSALDWDWGALP